MRIKALLRIITCFLIPTFAFATSAHHNEKKAPILVGTSSGYAPFASLDENGVFEGFDIDVAREIGKRLNRDVVFRDFGSMPSLMMGLKQNKADMLLWAISITDDRLKKMDMVYYQGSVVDQAPFLFWKNVPENIQTIADLEKDPSKVICIEAGTSQEDLLRDYKNLNVKFADKVIDIIMDIRYGKCFTTTIDPSLVPRFTEQHPELRVVNLPIPKNAQVLGNGICINKSNPELASEVRNAIQAMREDGTIPQLEKKWNLSQEG